MNRTQELPSLIAFLSKEHEMKKTIEPAGRPMHPKALKHWVGERVEIPVHYDAWMRGARFGLVTSVALNGLHINVKMDHPQIRRIVKVAVADLHDVKILRFGARHHAPEEKLY